MLFILSPSLDLLYILFFRTNSIARVPKKIKSFSNNTFIFVTTLRSSKIIFAVSIDNNNNRYYISLMMRFQFLFLYVTKTMIGVMLISSEISFNKKYNVEL